MEMYIDDPKVHWIIRLFSYYWYSLGVIFVSGVFWMLVIRFHWHLLNIAALVLTVGAFHGIITDTIFYRRMKI